jgi:hypothetical protein
MRWKEVGFLYSCRHGGELAEEMSISACVWVGVRASSSMHTPLLHDGAHHMANKLVAMIRCHEDGHFSRYLASASTTFLLEASEEDPDRRNTPPCGQVVSSPAAGRRWLASESRRRWRRFWTGSRFYTFPLVFFVICKDLFLAVFLQDPFCKMYPPLGN